MHLTSTCFGLAIALSACGGSTFDSGFSTGGSGGEDGGSGGTNGQGGSTGGQAGSVSTGSAGSTGSGIGGSAGATTGSGGGAGSGGAGSGGVGSGGMGGAGGGTACPGVPCTLGFICCSGACVNPNNDILNCGHCGQTCAGPDAFCAAGTCGQPPCLRGALCPDPTTCCASQCCSAGQLCCDVPGPGPSIGPRCTDPIGGTCPKGCPACICASPDTPIATPEGTKAIATLRAGDLVYSVVHGKVAAVPIRQIRRVAAHDHTVARLVMESGVVLEISGVHPTADGRTLGVLRAGDELDGVRVRDARVIPYRYDATYDILPASDSGAYFAGGILIGSTLASADAVEVLSATAPACE